MIVKVGQVNIQNQPLSNLRDLILGEPGTFVVLGFNSGSQFYEARMMHGTPDFLDKPCYQPQHMQQGVGLLFMTTQDQPPQVPLLGL